MNFHSAGSSGRGGKWLAAAAVTGAIVFLVKNPKFRGRAKSLATRAMGRSGAGRLNDAGLAHKIRSEVLGSHPTASINVNVEEGVAVLRGQVPTIEEISDIEQAVRKVSGITDVKNLLHKPDQGASATGESPRPGEAQNSVPDSSDSPGGAEAKSPAQATGDTPPAGEALTEGPATTVSPAPAGTQTLPATEANSSEADQN